MKNRKNCQYPKCDTKAFYVYDGKELTVFLCGEHWRLFKFLIDIGVVKKHEK